MKFFKRFLIVLLLSAAFISTAAAEDESVFKQYDDALGGFYGEIGGSGLSYQHWFDKFGIQASLGLSYYPEADASYVTSWSTDPVYVDLLNYDVAVEVQYMLYQDSYSDWLDGCLYIFAGGKHSGSIRNKYTYEKVVVTPADTELDPYDTFPTTGKTGPYYTPGFTAGFGIGFEPVFFTHFSTPLEFGLSGAWELGSIIPVDAGLKVQAGLRYRF
jgi:hypothetical protein